MIGGQSCHPYPTPSGWTLPGEGLCQSATAAMTKSRSSRDCLPASLSPVQAGGEGSWSPGDLQAWLFHRLESQNHPCHHFLGESRLCKVLYKGTQLEPERWLLSCRVHVLCQFLGMGLLTDHRQG